MSVPRHSLRVVDADGNDYSFTLTPEGYGQQALRFASRPWESGDPVTRFRKQIHPFTGGLAENKLSKPDSYQKSNADAQWPNLLLFPPKRNDVDFSAITTGVTKALVFDGKVFFLGGRYMYTIDPTTHTAAQDKDFGADKAGVDMAVFNDELIVAMGASEKIHKRTTADVWSQATDNTFALALGVSGKYLWRVTSTNLVSNCTTTPLTLASWAPTTDANKYVAGDTTHAVTGIVDYGGTPWIMKANGAYQGNNATNFFNQTPNVSIPHADNGKNAFTAQGYLWYPSVNGLMRIKLGESMPNGPEKSGRPEFRWFVRGGVEYNGNIYLSCIDLNAVDQACIVMMQRVNANAYTYHELCRFGNTGGGYGMALIANSGTAELYFGNGNDASYISLGKGSGRYIDETTYAYGSGMSLETGEMAPGRDLSVISTLVGVSVLCNYSRVGESLYVSARFDSDAYQDLLSSQEGGGVKEINRTDGWESVLRYARPGTSGQALEVRLTGTLTGAAVTATLGILRPEIREVWAFGYSRPRMTDVITAEISIDSTVRTQAGARHQIKPEHLHNLFRRWLTDSDFLELKIPGYETENKTRFLVADVSAAEDQPTRGAGGGTRSVKTLTVTFVRADFGSDYARD